MNAPNLHVLESFAEGGMGKVYLAFRRGEGFKRTLALKRLHAHLQGDSKAHSELLREAQWSGLLRHPNAVEVIDVGQDDEGIFLLMDFVEGMSLRELVSDLKAPLPQQLALTIGGSIALALWAAHSLTWPDGSEIGLIHRDVSQSNVLIGFDGTVRLSDFGLARAAVDPRTQEHLRGTSGYMAPEQLRFEPVDHRSDLFALGVVTYELLSGDRLYGDEDFNDAARRIVREPVPDIRARLPHVEPELAQLLSALLSKAPASRPDSALEVHRALEAARRALVRREGPTDLRDFLHAQVPERIAERRAWLAKQWARVAHQDGLPLQHAGSSSAVITQERQVQSDAEVTTVRTRDSLRAPVPAISTSDQHKPRGLRAWAMGLGLTLIAVTALVVQEQADDDPLPPEQDSAQSAPRQPAPSKQVPPEPADPTAANPDAVFDLDDIEAETEPEIATEPEPQNETPEADEPATTPPPSMRARRATRPRRSGMMSAPTKMQSMALPEGYLGWEG